LARSIASTASIFVANRKSRDFEHPEKKRTEEKKSRVQRKSRDLQKKDRNNTMEQETLTIAQLEELMASHADIPPEQLALVKASLTQFNEKFQQYDQEYTQREAKLANDMEELRQNEEALALYKTQYEQARQQEERENQQVLAHAQPLSEAQYTQMVKPLAHLPPILSGGGTPDISQSATAKPFNGHVHQSTVQMGYVNPVTQTAFLRISRATRNAIGQYDQVTGKDGQPCAGYNEGPDSQYDETLVMEQCLPLSLLATK
jgi:hypothetical protein